MKIMNKMLTRAATYVAALAVGSVLVACTASPAPTPSLTAVPAPGGGSVTETVPPAPAPSPLEADLTTAITPAEGTSLRLAKIDAIQAKAQGPGEVSGPGLAITVEIENTGSEALDTALLSVNLEDAKGMPGSGMVGSPAAWINGAIPPGGKASGVYVFTVPVENREPVKVSVSVNPGLPTAVFSGSTN